MYDGVICVKSKKIFAGLLITLIATSCTIINPSTSSNSTSSSSTTNSSSSISSSTVSSSSSSSSVSSSSTSSSSKPSSSSSSSSSTEKLYANFVSANDIHGRLVTADGEYGLDILSSKFNDLERKYGDFIKIANGDIFQGKFESNVMYGKPMIDCMNAMDFDAMVIGNHEFDWGIDKIAAYNDGDYSNGEADFPFLSCNIAYKSNNQLLDWVEP